MWLPFNRVDDDGASGVTCTIRSTSNPDSKVHGANMGHTWVLSVPYGPHVGPWTLLLGKGTDCICPYSCLLPRHCINHTMDMDTLARIVTLTKSQLCKYLLGCAVPVHKCLPLVYRKLAIYPFITNHWSLNNIDLDCDISHCSNWKSNFGCWIWFFTVILRVSRTCKLFLTMFVYLCVYIYVCIIYIYLNASSNDKTLDLFT